MFLPAQLSGVQRRRCLKVLRGKPVLLVGESPGFAASGGMINFVAAEQAVHFEINNETCHQAGLKLNAKLLSLGKRVHSP